MRTWSAAYSIASREYASAWCMPSVTSPANLNDFGPRIAPILIGIRSCTGRAEVNMPVQV